jgi:outer membrane protein TolC
MDTLNVNRKVITLLFLGAISVAWTQNDSPSQNSHNLNMLLLPVEVYIDSALAQNGLLRYRQRDLAVRESDVKTKERIWTQNVGLRGDLRYGTFNNFVSSNDGGINNSIATLSQQVNYGIGLYIQLPVFDIWNRKNESSRARVQVEQAQDLVEDQEEVVREKVIMQYEEVRLKFELLKIHSTNFGNAHVNMEMVEKEFRNGQVPVYEYVRLSDITSRIQAEYEKAKSDFLISKQLLENTSGLTIQ